MSNFPAVRNTIKCAGEERGEDTGYEPSYLNWALGGAASAGLLGAGLGALPDSVERWQNAAVSGALGLGGGALAGAVSAALAKHKLRKMRKNKNEPITKGRSMLTGGKLGGKIGAGLGALLGGGLGLASNGLPGAGIGLLAGGIGGGLYGGLAGGSSGLGIGAVNRIAARRAGLLNDGGSLVDRVLGYSGGIVPMFLSQEPQREEKSASAALMAYSNHEARRYTNRILASCLK